LDMVLLYSNLDIPSLTKKIFPSFLTLPYPNQ
jgi:hypothetical protein